MFKLEIMFKLMNFLSYRHANFVEKTINNIKNLRLNDSYDKTAKRGHLHRMISNIWTDACSINTINTAATAHLMK